MAEGAEREIDGGLGVLFAGDVSQAESGGRAQLGGERLTGCAIGVRNDDGCAVSDEQPRGGCAEPGCATSDKEDMIRYLHCAEGIERRIGFKEILLRG
jgi:hypothetical protein